MSGMESRVVQKFGWIPATCLEALSPARPRSGLGSGMAMMTITTVSVMVVMARTLMCDCDDACLLID